MTLISFTADDGRINSTTQRFGFGNTVIGTADVTADTLTNAIRFAEASFISPIGIGNEAATDGDKIRLALGDNVIGNLRIADIAGQNYGLAELFLYAFG